MRQFGWSTLIGAAAVPTYIFIALPVLASIADFLGILGAQLPLRTRLAVGGALVCLLGALLVRWRCPKTIAHSKSRKHLEDLGGTAYLKEIWREDLNRKIDSVGLRDAIQTVRRMIKPPHSANTQELPDDAELNDVLTAIDRAEFKDLGGVSVAAKSNFEHIDKFWQASLGGILVLGWVLSGTGMVLAALSIFFDGG